MRRTVSRGAIWLGALLAVSLHGACGRRPLGFGDDPGFSNDAGGQDLGSSAGTGGAPNAGSGGQGPGGLGGRGGSGAGGRGAGGTGVAGRGAGGTGIGGTGVGGRSVGGVGGAGVGGALGGCDSVCQTGEMCVQGTCRGSSSRWVTLGGDVHHSGFNPNERGTPPLTEGWSVALGASPLWPAVSDGSLIYVSEQARFGPMSRVWAVSPAYGFLNWTHDFGSVFGVGQPSVDSGQVYIAHCNHATDTFMHSIVASTGKLFWSSAITAQWEHYWAPLVVPGGSIYFDGGSYGGLYGLKSAGGSPMFFNSGLEQYDEWSPLFLDGRLYTFIEGNLRTHDPSNGSVVAMVSVTWNWAGWSMMTAPISDGDQIYLIAPPSLYALRPGDAGPRWSATAGYSGMPAVANGVVYAITDRQLRAHDASTGAVLWSFAGDGALSHPPVVAANFVYVASDYTVYAVDLTTQDAVWKVGPGGWLSIANGQLYVAQPNGTLAAYNLTAP